MNRRLVLALACLGAALGGCATQLATSTAPSYDAAASPATVSPAALPPNAFGPEMPHDFGSGGP